MGDRATVVYRRRRAPICETAHRTRRRSLTLRGCFHALAVAVLAAHREHLLHLGDELVLLVAHLDDEGGLEAFAGVGGDANELDLGARDLEARRQRAAAGAAEVDGGGLVPHRVAGPQLGGEEDRKSVG